MTTEFTSLSQAARRFMADAVEALGGAQPERFESWRIALEDLPENRRDSALLPEI